MREIILRNRLVMTFAGTVVAVSLFTTGCGKEDVAAQGNGYVTGTEATRKGGGGVSAAPAMSKGKANTDTPDDGKPGENKATNATVTPPSNTVQTQGGSNLAL